MHPRAQRGGRPPAAGPPLARRGQIAATEAGTMRSSRTVSATLAAVLMAASLAACGGASGGGGGGGNCSGGSSRVEVVVELGNHQVLDRCVGFTGTALAAETILHDSGIEFAIQHFSFGEAVRQVQNLLPIQKHA